MKESAQKPCVLTIFGASGDLAKLKIFPSLFALAERNLLPPQFVLVGYARSAKTQEQFRKEFSRSVLDVYGKRPGFSKDTLKKLEERVFYFSGQYDEQEDFAQYRKFVASIVGKEDFARSTHIAYFSVPPSIFHPILENLAQTRERKNEDLRIVLEKPFGEDEKSARKLFHFLSRYFTEEQVYLLDHYLGKSGVQSILSLRHANSILNMLLKGKEIASIQLTATEDIGLKNRVGYFDSVGIIKDMFQSHLTQILAMITMSIPISEEAESFQREKYAILSALKFSPQKQHIYLGQYEGYQSLPDVPKGSTTETFMAVKVKIDRESWYGVPIFIRTGKKLHKKATYIVIEFKKMKFQRNMEPNRLILELQPDEKIHFKLVNKHGQSTEYQDVIPTQSIACTGESCLPEHSTLLLDVIRKHKLHFLSFAEIIASWRITDSILGFVKRAHIPTRIYEDGIVTPLETQDMFRKPGEGWYEIDGAISGK